MRRMQVRPSILAGTWYPRDAADLTRDVDAFLDVESAGRPAPRALVVPHAGIRYSGGVAGHAYATLPRGAYHRVLLLGVSHFASFAGASMLEVDAYETPLGRIPLPGPEERARLREAAGLQELPRAHAREHSIEIQLPFLQRALGEEWTLVPILLRELDEVGVRDLGRALRPWCDERTLVIASSDFTHYGHRFDYEPFPGDARLFDRLAELDGGAVERIRARDPEGLLDYRARTGITMCGIRPVATLLHMLPADAVGAPLSYDTSGRMTHDHEHSVSYQAIAFAPRFPELGLTAKVEDGLLALARRVVHTAAGGMPLPVADETVRDLPAADVFVTLRQRATGELRGCIGSVGSPRPLAKAVRDAAEGAALRDPRFSPVEPDEVERLTIDVSVLTPLRPAAPEDIEVGRHGVVLELGRSRGVYLPQVATELGWDRERLLQELCRKAQLPTDAFLEPDANLSTFESVSLKEEPRS